MEFFFEKMNPAHEIDVMDIFNYYCQNSFAAYPEGKMPNPFYSRFLEIGNTYPAFVVKTAENTIIGFCMLKPFNLIPSFKTTAEISYFFRKDFTGKGAGKAALNKLEEEALKMGVKHLLASISSENQPSLEFHKKNGFIQCGCFHDIGVKFGKTFSMVWMEKAL